MGRASTWTMALISEVPVSWTGSGLTETMMLGGVPPVPPVAPPPPLAHLALWGCFTQLGPALVLAADATTDIPNTGRVTTTARVTRRMKRGRLSTGGAFLSNVHD